MGALADMLFIERTMREQDAHRAAGASLRGLLMRIGDAADDPDEVRRLVSLGLTGIEPAPRQGQEP